MSSYLNAIFRVSRPLSLLAGVLLYALGGGIANYLGYTINWSAYWLGQGAVTALQLSSYFLREYFDLVGRPPFEAQARPGEGPTGPPRGMYMQVAATTLTVGAVLTVLMIASGVIDLAGLFIIGVAVLLALAYAVPPMRLVYSGYGELVLSILSANLFPALAFLLQSGELHRLLALMTFPLTLLYLAMALARSLQTYLEDIRRERRTMMARLGWQRGMNVHNILIALAYIMLALSVISGLPWNLAFPAFLSMPVGLFQVWQINSIANGGKPRWRLLSITAIATLGLTAYFMNLALWTG